MMSHREYVARTVCSGRGELLCNRRRYNYEGPSIGDTSIGGFRNDVRNSCDVFAHNNRSVDVALVI